MSHTTNKKVVTFGEIMLRLSTPGFARFVQADSFNATYGGGEANVALSLTHLGVPAEHVTRFPDNDLGKAATQLLRKNGVETGHILYGGPRIGIYFLETGASVRPSKVVYDRANSSFAEIQPGMINWEDVFKDAAWFHWTGITPALSQGAADACLEAIQVANRLGVKVSADLNYRKNLWKYGKTAAEVLPALTAGCDIVFASRGDMEEILGETFPETPERYLQAGRKLIATYPRIKKIFNTKRSSVSASHNTLSATVFDGQNFLKTATLDINPIIDRIGGGDAFVAGILFGLGHYPSDQQALDFGLAASVLKHSIEGDANIVTVEEVELIVAGETGGRLSR